VGSLPPSAKYEAGTVVQNKYRLERKLGEGGMGSVWAAYHVALDTMVAVKLIRADTNRQEMGPRLLQEARAAAKLGHPAIVRVFDVGQTADGDPFIVMELLEGESLNQRLVREHRLTATEAVRLLLPIADALSVAHAKGIVHRDIKPDNVFLVGDGTTLQPKLVDFGIAKLQAREFDSQLTQKGVIVGSPDYMAPEQARGEENIDQRADIWSFCVLLYELVSGQPPFDGANYNALLRAIVETTPVSLAAMHAADSELSQLIDTGLAKDRALRWQSMQALGEQLARWLLKQGIFEDAAGGAIESKWVTRRSDAGYRQSQPSFSSIPGFATTSPGLGRDAGVSTQRRLVAEAPTSAGPVVTVTERRKRYRLLLPAALAGLGAAAFAVWTQRPHLSSEAAQAAPVATSPTFATAPGASAAATTLPPPRAAEIVPSPVATSNGRSAGFSERPAAGSSVPRAVGPARARPRSAPAVSAGPAPAKSKLDLLTPY
jgi:serine/threonine protein kinase